MQFVAAYKAYIKTKTLRIYFCVKQKYKYTKENMLHTCSGKKLPMNTYKVK